MANKKRMQLSRERQEAAARKRRMTYAGIGGAAVLIIAALAVFLSRVFTPQAAASAVSSVSSAGSTACGPVQTVADEWRLHLSPGQTPTYQANPPSSGTHNPVPLPAGIYDSPVDVTMEVHSQEHGYIIIHYNNIPSDEIQQLKDIVSRDPRKLILSPYPNMSYKVSLTAWDHMQTCEGPNATAIASFVAQFRDQGPEAVP